MHRNIRGFLNIQYLDQLSSLKLLCVTELASFADQFATLKIDNTLRIRVGDISHIYHRCTKSGVVS